MKVIPIAVLICTRVARLGSFAMSLTGLVVFNWVDFRSNILVMTIFVVLPLLSFPVSLLFYRQMRANAIAHWILALGYLAVYSILDWRTCSADGYCQSVAQVVAITLTAWRVEGMFIVALAATAIAWLAVRRVTHVA